MDKKLEEALDKVDQVVLKRLKFIHKILKAISNPMGNKNRNVHIHLLEVLDAVGDAGDSRSQEVLDMVDQQVFPLLCHIISTSNPNEFNLFQRTLLRYTLIKWKETGNFHILRFIADICSFIVRIAPSQVVNEYLQIFSRKGIPSPVTLIVFPAIVTNMPDRHKLQLPKLNGLNANLLCLTQNGEVTEDLEQEILKFWCSLTHESLGTEISPIIIILQCITTAYHLNFIRDKNLIKIMDGFTKRERQRVNSNNFVQVLCMLIFLVSVNGRALNRRKNPDLFTSATHLLEQIVSNVKLSNTSTAMYRNKFLMRILQAIFENMEDEPRELLEAIKNSLYTNGDSMEVDYMDINLTTDSECEISSMLKTLEDCIEKLKVNGYLENEGCKIKFKKILESIPLSIGNYERNGSDDDELFSSD